MQLLSLLLLLLLLPLPLLPPLLLLLLLFLLLPLPLRRAERQPSKKHTAARPARCVSHSSTSASNIECGDADGIYRTSVPRGGLVGCRQGAALHSETWPCKASRDHEDNPARACVRAGTLVISPQRVAAGRP